MIGKHTRYAALAIAAIACIAEAFAASRYEQEIEDYIVVDNAANIVQLTAIGSGPNPPLASQAAKTQLHFRCVALGGQLIGFPTITVHGSGVSYSAIAYQSCLIDG
jgi:hypothetical protein